MTECKICKDDTNTPDNPLISPCLCIGTIGKVHNDCVESWIRASGNNKCSECNTEYSTIVCYTGPIPQSLVLHLQKHIVVNTIISIITILGTVGVISFTSCKLLWNYLLMSPLTVTNVALLQAISYSTYVLIGFGVGIIRQVTISFNNREYRLDGDSLILPITNVIAICNYIIACHHKSFTGWTYPVVVMYYLSLYKLWYTIFIDFSKWYNNHYYRTRYVDIRGD